MFSEGHAAGAEGRAVGGWVGRSRYKGSCATSDGDYGDFLAAHICGCGREGKEGVAAGAIPAVIVSVATS